MREAFSFRSGKGKAFFNRGGVPGVKRTFRMHELACGMHTKEKHN
ncbi:hypothetical protein B4098_2952 [Heyndrickxia coagulans]|jgi:hypothetical protein|uniref:Uncharacterized protein n=1 Tax=Heyndrickxia coagulans TaxID=1398 RepID=A0A150JSM9_HEYCO|nr:hypothetical protein B4098_2952 [Heyndrickxia coagulans]